MRMHSLMMVMKLTNEINKQGNPYIAANPVWDSMGLTTDVRLTCTPCRRDRDSKDNGDSKGDMKLFCTSSCGPCYQSPQKKEKEKEKKEEGGRSCECDYPSSCYASFSTEDNHWVCPDVMPVDSCAPVAT
jgi:hypothetical protein